MVTRDLRPLTSASARVDHEQIAVVVGAAEWVERGPRRVGSHSNSAALMRGGRAVDQPSQHGRKADRPQTLLHLTHQPFVGSHIASSSIRARFGSLSTLTRLLDPADPRSAARKSTASATRNSRARMGCAWLLISSRRRRPFRTVGYCRAEGLSAVRQIEVIETEGLLVNGVVSKSRADGYHGRRVVIHEIAADHIRAVR